MLRFIKPLEPTLTQEPPAGPDWIHEIKQDGYRTQMIVEDGQARAFSRRGLDWSSKYRPIVDAAAMLKCTSAIVDGEMIIQDEHGRSDFAALIANIKRHPDRIVFIAFDLLHLDGEDLRSQSLEERRAKLKWLLRRADPRLAFSEEFEGEGEDLFRLAEEHELEGIVSKRKGSHYKSGSSRAWLKTKSVATGMFDVIGVEKSTETGIPVALLASEGRYVGNAMINLPAKLRDAFWRYVELNSAPTPPIKGMKRKGATWVRPGLQGKVKHLRGEGMLRHGTLLDAYVVEPADG